MHNTQSLPHSRPLRWCALACAGVVATAALSGQQLFDFETDAEGWTEGTGEGAVVGQSNDIPEHATSGTGLLTVTGGDGWFEAASVVMAVGSAQHTAIVAAADAGTPSAILFDGIFDPDYDNGYRANPGQEGNPWFQVNAVVQSPGWQQFDKLMDEPWPDETTIYTMAIPMAELDIDAEEDITITLIFNNSGGAGYTVLFDNFRLGDAGDGPGTDPVTPPVGETWLGYAVGEDGWANTGDWLGHVWVGNQPWVYQLNLGYLYVSEESHTDSGAWIYGAK